MITTVLRSLAADVDAALGDAGSVSLSTPSTTSDLPAVTLAARDLTQTLVGIGRLPRGTRTGALLLEAVVDLADPTLDLGEGEVLTLLDAQRRVLTLPHGPLVRADGTSDEPFAAQDVAADDGTPFVLLGSGEPTGREFVCDPLLGVLRFGAPLPGTGVVRVAYHVGRWDVTVSRFQGIVEVDVTAADEGSLEAVTDGVVTALAESGRVPGRDGPRLTPREHLAGAPLFMDDVVVRHRLLRYRMDAEVEHPLLTSGGGVIARVAVRARLHETDETFTVEREGNPA